jgi:hypothetical protein
MNTTTPISYKEMLTAMGERLNERKPLLLKRVLLMQWPFLLLIPFIYIFQEREYYKTLSTENAFLYGGIFVGYLLLAAIYSVIVSFTFEIEKQIWIDSYFDNRDLDQSQSWRIARALFWPAFVFRLKISLRYYFLPIGTALIAIAALCYGTFTMTNDVTVQSNLTIAVSITGLVVFIGLALYGYYIKTKLRYTWFIFLDRFGNNQTHAALIEEMKKLNAISASDTFKKSLMASLGTDTVKGLVSMTVSGFAGALSSSGEIGKALGGAIQIYGQEANRQMTDFANQAAQYVLYRFARKEAHGTEQEVNEALYRLATRDGISRS